MGAFSSCPAPFGAPWDGPPWGAWAEEEAPILKKLLAREAAAHRGGLGAGTGRGPIPLGRGRGRRGGLHGRGLRSVGSLVLRGGLEEEESLELGREEGSGSSVNEPRVPFLKAFLQSSCDSATSAQYRCRKGRYTQYSIVKRLILHRITGMYCYTRGSCTALCGGTLHCTVMELLRSAVHCSTLSEAAVGRRGVPCEYSPRTPGPRAG